MPEEDNLLSLLGQSLVARVPTESMIHRIKGKDFSNDIRPVFHLCANERNLISEKIPHRHGKEIVCQNIDFLTARSKASRS